MENTSVLDWQVVAHSGKMFRFGADGGLTDLPEPHEFPLLLQPIPHHQLLIELEQLQLEEELLVEQLKLLEQQKLVNAAIASAPPGCYLVESVPANIIRIYRPTTMGI